MNFPVNEKYIFIAHYLLSKLEGVTTYENEEEYPDYRKSVGQHQ